jgi:hypothetical protein
LIKENLTISRNGTGLAEGFVMVEARVQSSLTGLMIKRPSLPSDESLGYFQVSLTGQKHLKNLAHLNQVLLSKEFSAVSVDRSD